jgi:hypothetical protein
LLDDVVCPLCSDLFHNPKCLASCSAPHPCCQTCITDAWKATGVVECPVCTVPSSPSQLQQAGMESALTKLLEPFTSEFRQRAKLRF